MEGRDRRRPRRVFRSRHELPYAPYGRRGLQEVPREPQPLVSFARLPHDQLLRSTTSRSATIALHARGRTGGRRFLSRRWRNVSRAHTRGCPRLRRQRASRSFSASADARRSRRARRHRPASTWMRSRTRTSRPRTWRRCSACSRTRRGAGDSTGGSGTSTPRGARA